MEDLDEAVARLSAASDRPLGADQGAVALLAPMPGVRQRTAESLLAERGTDMTRVPHATHLASWAGLCPGHHASGGKRLRGKPRTGNRCLRHVWGDVAPVASTTQPTSLAAPSRRRAARRGPNRARIAVGHPVLGLV